MKKFIVVLLAINLLLTSFNSIVSGVEKEGNFSYKKNADNSGSIVTNFSGTGDVVIPDTLGGLPVTEVAEDCFSWNSEITSVKIPETVTRIGAGAFNRCSNLKNVNIPDGIEAIEDELFSLRKYCNSRVRQNNWKVCFQQLWTSSRN